MKRLHIHVRADDLAASERFYTSLFGQAPTVTKTDYMKWMLDDPRVNFAVSQTDGGDTGVNHLGIQVDSDGELESVNASLLAADQATQAEPNAACCYANSNKHWAEDPQGVVWEMFHTMGEAMTYNNLGPDLAEVKPAPRPMPLKKPPCC